MNGIKNTNMFDDVRCELNFLRKQYEDYIFKMCSFALKSLD